MAKIEEIIAPERLAKDIIADLQIKTISVPAWSELEKEYNPKNHPVMKDPSYIDKVTKTGIEKVTRITIDLQRLAVKRMTELAFGIPVKRNYSTEIDQGKQLSQILEKILKRNRINSLNIERGKMLFAGCEVITLWYATEEPNTLYGFDSKIKLRCKNYSPTVGDILYPLFDETDDMVALSIQYTRTEGKKTRTFFDTFTKDTHIQWENTAEGWTESIRENHTLGKIPGAYITRPTPIWEDTSNNVYEIEWALSRNGNYLRKNSKPIFAIFSDEDVTFGEEKDDDFRSIFQYPTGGSANYITWPQATESLKFQIDSLYRAYFTQLQLPDMSYESMKSTPMSGEARKMLFLDCQLKVTEESGRWLEFFDREINVIKEFMKTMLPAQSKAIDALQVEVEITPYQVNDDKDTIGNIMLGTAGKPIISQAEGVRLLGWSANPDDTIKELEAQDMAQITSPTL